jgi:hypothetical protein
LLLDLAPLRLILHGLDGIPSSSVVLKNLGVIVDKRITWRLNIEMIEADALRTPYSEVRV